MPTIIPIRDLRNTSEISDIAHKKQEPISLDVAKDRLDKKYYG